MTIMNVILHFVKLKELPKKHCRKKTVLSNRFRVAKEILKFVKCYSKIHRDVKLALSHHFSVNTFVQMVSKNILTSKDIVS